MLGAGGLVIGWYVWNEAAGGGASRGVLAIRDAADEPEAGTKGPRWRRRKGRLGGQAASRAASALEAADRDEPAPSFKPAARGYRKKDDPAYRARGPLPRFGEKP